MSDGKLFHADRRRKMPGQVSTQLNCVKNCTSLLFKRQTKGLHLNSKQMLFKISHWTFTHVSHASRRCRHCPIASATCLWSSSVHTWISRCFNSSIFAMCVRYTFSCMILQTEQSTTLKSAGFEAISQVVWHPVSVCTVCNSLTDVVRCITSGKGLTQIVSMQ